jgi:hypothetical protein
MTNSQSVQTQERLPYFRLTDLVTKNEITFQVRYVLYFSIIFKSWLVRMGSSEKFCLRWNDFESNISVAFRELREDKDVFDVTLACDDDQIQAHKVILSACSPFFRSILKGNRHEHPLLYLKGVK